MKLDKPTLLRLALVLGGRAGVSAVRMEVLAPLPISLRIVRTKV